MAAKATQDKIEVNKGAMKVASAVAKVYEIVGSSGNIVTQCVTSAKSIYKGAEIPRADLNFIAEQVARIRNWSPSSAKVRKSEVRKVLRAYNELPGAITKFCKKSDTFTWHQAVKLSRLLGNKTVNQAVAAMLTTATPEAPTPAKILASALTRIGNIDARAGSKVRVFQEAVAALATKHGL